MKKYILIAALGLALTSCDEVLDRPQLNTPDDNAFWKTESDVRLYANGFYTEYFTGHNSGWSSAYTYRAMTFCDDYASTGQQSNFISQVPEDAGTTTSGYVGNTGGQTWCFSMVRKANIFLDRLEERMQGVLDEEQYAHWRAVAKFFKAFEYTRLVITYGDVPYYEHTVSSSDFDELYKERTPRNEVMGHVYDLCKDILRDMRLNDGANVLNRYVAAGFISRWMLFEGTWQRYNENNDELARKYLQLAVEAGDLVIKSGKYSIATPMKELFGSFDLASNKECLLYRHYDYAIGVKHCITSYCNGVENAPSAVNLAFLKSLICVDGKPYKTSTVENADLLSVPNIAKTRDPRFEAQFADVAHARSATRVYGNKYIDRYGFSLKAPGTTPEYGSANNTIDAPVMRYGEVLLNWIEAKAELGGVTQADIDKSINQLRARPLDAVAQEKGLKNTAPMVLSEIDAAFDPDRDSDVDPLVWEIRRERRLEMVFEFSRLVDIRRWHKLHYMDNRKYPDTMRGPWIDFNEELTETLAAGKTTVFHADGTRVVYDGNNAAEMAGFYEPQNAQPRLNFSDRSYLYPIGTKVIDSYKEKDYTISQTKGW